MFQVFFLHFIMHMFFSTVTQKRKTQLKMILFHFTIYHRLFCSSFDLIVRYYYTNSSTRSVSRVYTVQNFRCECVCKIFDYYVCKYVAVWFCVCSVYVDGMSTYVFDTLHANKQIHS